MFRNYEYLNVSTAVAQSRALQAAVLGSKADRLRIPIFPGTGIRKDGRAEPQSLVSAPKYIWVNFQIPLQCICCEGILTAESDYLLDRDVKPSSIVVAF